MRALSLLLPLMMMMMTAAPAAAQTTDWTQAIVEWTRPTTPFRVVGNVYYVGTAGVSVYLITSPQGHILIDGAMDPSVDGIVANIRALGFRIEDVRYLLINHAHFDHAGGLARLKALSGAQLLASVGDAPDLEAGMTAGRTDLLHFAPVHVDRLILNGMHVRWGAIDLVTHLTPGHTKGCTSWSLRTAEMGRPLDVLFACSLTAAGQDLTGGNPVYPGVADDFRRTFRLLRGLQADVFLSFHPAVFDMEAKRKALEAGDRFAFVDAHELGRRVDAAEAAFEKELEAQTAAKRGR
ncbi:subclass B3 metallo-beta-lactamase [Sphingomonas sp. LB-2]|uniref:subclass B3 metallo-beta-lactamase n=1 Tax=Sphingomonas caeni TaxID=2984949 RepID=UPI00222E0B1D|nr:subclass B3 metallo-beta-lactamase [Sphingomonas caeni]MCW3847642.1 subclass B3 metallo-beta-lactamase [Sphingomonas caeni]